MCTICGCEGENHDHHHDDAHAGHPGHDHPHAHAHVHAPGSGPAPVPRVSVEQAVLAKNERTAHRNRAWLAGKRILALNLLSSPGAGKTTLLESLIARAGGSISVVEGDQETDHDAERIRRAGARALQVNTGQGCHLDAEMVARALEQLDPPSESIVMIENVGNLVCPALFDLGERAKILVASVTEGEDKPLKYPHVFRASKLVILNKMDLLPHVRFDVERFEANARSVNAAIRVVHVSAIRGDGVEALASLLADLRGAELARTSEGAS